MKRGGGILVRSARPSIEMEVGWPPRTECVKLMIQIQIQGEV